MKKQKKTAEQKIKLIKKWSNWFYSHTDSYDSGYLGTDLAYLWAAIANNTYIEVSGLDRIIEILIEHKVSRKNEIWDHIRILDEVTDEYVRS